MKFIPRTYQADIAKYMLSHKRAMIMAACGMGKTSATLSALNVLLKAGKVKKILIVAPLRVALNVWSQEAQKWDNFSHLRIKTLCGLSAKKRAESVNDDCDILTINYELIPWLIDNSELEYDCIVCDESTKLKGYRRQSGSKRAHIFFELAKATERIILLTGTPAPNGLLDLWGQMYFVDFGRALETSFTRFCKEYFRPVQVAQNAFAVKWVALPDSQKRIEEKLKDCTISILPEKYFNLEKPIVNNISVTLPEKLKFMYKRMKKEGIVAFDNHSGIVAPNAAVKVQKLLQIAGGFIYDIVGNYNILSNHKLEAIESIINESGGENVIVCYNWQAELAQLTEYFPAAVKMDKSPETLQKWNEGQIPILLLNPASAGHGLNLQHGGRILIFISPTYNLEHYLQVIERIGPMRQKQSGYNRSVYIYHVFTENTIEPEVYECLNKKENVQEKLLKNLEKGGDL